MADKLQFQSKLNGILKLAMENQYKLTCEQVEEYFFEDQLSEDQLELVFDYLQAQKVAVKGYEKTSGQSKKDEDIITLSEDEEAYLSEYLKDLGAIKIGSDDEVLTLFEEINNGNALAKSRMTEIYLPRVVEIGKEMHHRELFVGDIIQEGNVSLMLALESLPRLEELGIEGLKRYLEREIKQGIQMLIEETVDLKGRDQRMVERVSSLDENITKLTEELGRKVTMEELALYTEMTEDEILEVFKLTGEDVEEEKE